MSACRHCGTDLGETAQHYCDSACRKAGETNRATAKARQDLEAALRAVTRHEGADAALTIVDRVLGKRGRGRPRKDLTPAQLSAARRAAETIASGGKIEGWRLARTAKMSPQAFSNRFAFPEDGRTGGDRYADFWGAVTTFLDEVKDETM